MTSRVRWLPSSGVRRGDPGVEPAEQAQPGAPGASYTGRATHNAQPACREGNAASWLVETTQTRGAEASAPHRPVPRVEGQHVGVARQQAGRRRGEHQVQREAEGRGDESARRAGR